MALAERQSLKLRNHWELRIASSFTAQVTMSLAFCPLSTCLYSLPSMKACRFPSWRPWPQACRLFRRGSPGSRSWRRRVWSRRTTLLVSGNRWPNISSVPPNGLICRPWEKRLADGRRNSASAKLGTTIRPCSRQPLQRTGVTTRTASRQERTISLQLDMAASKFNFLIGLHKFFGPNHDIAPTQPDLVPRLYKGSPHRVHAQTC